MAAVRPTVLGIVLLVLKEIWVRPMSSSAIKRVACELLGEVDSIQTS
jgi:hypothetical protein